MDQTTVDRIIATSDNVIAFPTQRRTDEPRFFAFDHWWTHAEWAEYEEFVAENFG